MYGSENDKAALVGGLIIFALCAKVRHATHPPPERAGKSFRIWGFAKQFNLNRLKFASR
jgi:hypothetical protein